MDSLVIACILVALYLGITFVTPRLLHRPKLLLRRPAAVLRIWLTALFLACIALLSALGIFIARALRHHITHVEGHDVAGPLIDSILGWLSIAAIGIITFRLGVAAQELRSANRSLSDLVTPLLSDSSTLTISGHTVWSVPSEQLFIAALPQANRVVVSNSMISQLDPRQLGAAVEHEVSHLKRHHSRVLAVAALAEAVAPAFLAGQRLAQSSRIATELIADDDAAKIYGSQVTASALLAAYPQDGSIADRATRLLQLSSE